ncbi:MAG: Asp-tRNA(Asn)/Glu-tRNA(Gln) amidotransferase subunit GatC [Saprospiraceae bacterium]|jgi:aspartyl-tRNA(Asn)/glutamyl-tRNA(Gln) amidotransferase subunit C
MTIDETLILRLEKLSRLQLSTEERSTITKDLNNILGMIEKLEDLDTTGVEPLRHIIEENKPWREDIVNQSTTTADALKNAPNHDGSYFKVLKVIEK